MISLFLTGQSAVRGWVGKASLCTALFKVCKETYKGKFLLKDKPNTSFLRSGIDESMS